MFRSKPDARQPSLKCSRIFDQIIVVVQHVNHVAEYLLISTHWLMIKKEGKSEEILLCRAHQDLFLGLHYLNERRGVEGFEWEMM